ncbi:hypothetical protein RS130_12575 [Paraglaciecola aquimarina]|uniref:Hydrolase n=1 Tax=Paraglaciecola aquimarina TaxID=1235557 RepID=A0ABU3SXA9_9ALTE|nr:hypothetical protein [Paraglaciecola aquimarina]MDU0354638.1 hypothetical protein [Paraglaciecola aquimarina]
MALADLPLFTNRIDLVIFDCDGVLVDSEILSKRTILEMLRELGANVSEDYFYAHFLGYSFEHVTKKVLADYGLVLTDDFHAWLIEQLYKACLAQSCRQRLGLKIS